MAETQEMAGEFHSCGVRPFSFSRPSAFLRCPSPWGTDRGQWTVSRSTGEALEGCWGDLRGPRLGKRGHRSRGREPPGVTSRLPQCSCQASGIHVSKGIQSVWCHQAAVARHPPSFSRVRLRSGPCCSIQLLCACGPRLPEKGRRVSAGTWAPSDWPRDAAQTPGGAGSSLPAPRRCQVLLRVCGESSGRWPRRAGSVERGACRLPSVSSLPRRQPARWWPLERARVVLGGTFGEVVRTGCFRGPSGRHLQAPPNRHPRRGAETVSSCLSGMTQQLGCPDLCPDREPLAWVLVGGHGPRLCSAQRPRTPSHTPLLCCPGGSCTWRVSRVPCHPAGARLAPHELRCSGSG